ncbi:MAG TPA: tRNA (adenosine(37)-N6)-threonylcarbamoyltransferase complex transferase subunit TsaD [Myxococcales bacterium]|nr:tRNA (adenosine(37)-N6)-threonylcarbamoyltransferase complex transferase subunit TsaD [Myxococcales bacterium]HAN32735.1 tRNA (adenosine(37)-N6)-threonylcarbamoyltransferase complex transferase subunit TsaD [Myxococcales bacterium]
MLAADHFLAGPVLGIETSCDDTAVAVVVGGHVWTNRVSSQIPIHQRFGGVVPEVASRNHLQSILPTIETALRDVGLEGPDLAGIAVTNRPGLMGALLVGVQTAKTLALAWDVPLIGVHHIEAHCWAAMMAPPGTDRGAKQWSQPELPALALAVSGGHTSVFRVDGPGQSMVLGETLDDAAGEALDKFGKLLGLPYPAGPHVDRAARQGQSDRFRLPKGLKNRRDLAMSFSGLKTAGRQTIERVRAEGLDPAEHLADLCASYQLAAVTQLVDTTMRAARQYDLKDVIVAGGVAANSLLRHTLALRCEEQERRAWLTPRPYCTDNGAMIAGLGSALLARDQLDDPLTLDAQPTVRATLKARKESRDRAQGRRPK